MHVWCSLFLSSVLLSILAGWEVSMRLGELFLLTSLSLSRARSSPLGFCSQWWGGAGRSILSSRCKDDDLLACFLFSQDAEREFGYFSLYACER